LLTGGGSTSPNTEDVFWTIGYPILAIGVTFRSFRFPFPRIGSQTRIEEAKNHPFRWL
jgi:hypothetical protein